MTNLVLLDLAGNGLTNIVLPSDLARLQTLDLDGNALANLTLPTGLTNLVHEAKSPGPMTKARDRSRQLCKAGAMLRTRAGTSLPLLEGLSRSQNSNWDAKIPTGMPRVEPAC